MILDLDDERSLDPRLAGAKAAWLARGRRAGLPVLPGLVVPVDASRWHMARGADALGRRGSGGARLEVATAPLDPGLASALGTAARSLPGPLVVRSSAVVEASGAWSGAFTSYLDVDAADLDVAVRGCWAAAFSVAALRRQEAAAIPPGSIAMAVLVQPACSPDFGGTARLEGADVIVSSVAGSPAPLVQGWEPGARSRVGPTGELAGDEGPSLMGEQLVMRVAETLRRAHELVGATTSEWAAVGGEIVLLQLGRAPETDWEPSSIPGDLATDDAVRIARLVRRAPGPMGEELVLPWAVADAEGFLALDAADGSDTAPGDPGAALDDAERRARALTAYAWGADEGVAVARAAATLRALRSTDPGPALAAIARLRSPDPSAAGSVRSLLARVRHGLVERGAVARAELGWQVGPTAARLILAAGGGGGPQTRIGVDRWEPFDAQVVLTTGRHTTGVPASAGIGCGRLCSVTDPAAAGAFRPRDVIVASHPVPMLGALLWDAAAIVTTGGGPAAHLFESARALGIAAVSGVHLDEILDGSWREASGRFALAVDGNRGTVAVAAW